MECEKMKKALALALVISMAFVGSMFAQATPGSGNGNGADSNLAPGQVGHEEGGMMPGAAEGHAGAPGQTGDNPGHGKETVGE
jgi:hypothetical protein